MIRLLSIEYFKLKNTRFFWVLLVLFVIFLAAVPIGVKTYLNYMVRFGNEFLFTGIRSDELPFFDFVDIWQNLTWIYKSFSILLGFIVVISVSQEFTFGTIKQNVIDGLSRKQFISSKILFLILLAITATCMALFVGLLAGLAWSPVQELEFVFKHLEFLGAYFLHLVAFLLFCLVVTLLIKRAGITISFLIFYLYIIEPIITAILHYKYELPWLSHSFPVRAMSNIIPVPLTKYLLRETQTFVGIPEFCTLVVWIITLISIAYFLVSKRDLR